MKILFLTNLLPYPLDNGGKIKTYTTLKSLSEAGHDIDLLCFKETKESMKENESEILKLCHTVKQVYLPLTTADHKKYMVDVAIKSIFSTLPFSIYKYQSAEMLQELSAKKSIRYDVVYFDHLPLCIYQKQARKLWPDAKFLLDEHNCEAMITKRKARESHSVIKKIFLWLEGHKLADFESRCIQYVDKTIVLSQDDYNSLKQITHKDFNHTIIPIGVQDKGIKKVNISNCLNILFVGTLTWEPNNYGLIWFLEEVLSILEAKNLNYHLYIVGKNPSKDVIRLGDKYRNRVTVTGYVNSVDDYYDMCDCSVVPLFIGSGQRVKLIEAFSKGMPSVSTTIGAEGLAYKNNENILIADNAIEFANAILRIKRPEIKEKISKNARTAYEKYYSLNAVSALLLEAIQ